MPNAVPHNLIGPYEHCARITRDHYENFPVASWLLPARIRPHVCAIYAFARAADDFADEPGMTDEERLAHLDEWGRHLDSCLDTPEGPVFEALGNTIRQFDIPVSLFEDLLSAFRQDVQQSRHETFDGLLDYSKRSANPVGRLVLTLFGYGDTALLERSDAICTALQLTNFWQDIAVDFGRDRIYLPLEEMRAHGVTEDDLSAGSVTSSFRGLVGSLVARTRGLFVKGAGLPELVRGRLRYELRLTWLGGSRILDGVEAVDYDIFTRRPKLTRWTGLSLLLRSLRRLPV